MSDEKPHGGTRSGAGRKKMGRPSTYSEERARKICALTASGMSLRQVAAEPLMPGRDAIAVWLQERPDFMQWYLAARECCYEKWADEVISLSDEPAANMADVQRNRLRTDSRKWILSKLHPKQYGDKLQTEVSGRDGAPVEFKMVLGNDG